MKGRDWVKIMSGYFVSFFFSLVELFCFSIENNELHGGQKSAGFDFCMVLYGFISAT